MAGAQHLEAPQVATRTYDLLETLQTELFFSYFQVREVRRECSYLANYMDW